MGEFENFFDKLRKYCDFELEFDDTNKLFKFNKEYIDAHTADHFREDTLVFYDEFSRLYDVATDKLKFVEDTITIIKYTKSVFYNKNLLSPHNFKKIKGATVFTTDNPIVTRPHDFTPQSLKEAFENFNENSPKVIAFLLCNPDCPKVYRNQLIVERALLYFVMVEFCESLKYMEANLEKIIKELKTYQYCKLEDVNPVVISERCVIPFTKIEVAHIFQALFEEEIFTFPNVDGRKFTDKRNKFIDNNFTYVGNKKKQIPINHINVQFSDISNQDFEEEEKQLKIIENLHKSISKKLEERRQRVENNRKLYKNGRNKNTNRTSN
jgi:hypothetical protein